MSEIFVFGSNLAGRHGKGAHVRYVAKDKAGAAMTVAVADYVTPELGELLCTLHNNLPTIIEALRKR